MPHVFLEYTANLTDFDADKALLRINHALVASGQFGAEFDIKSRATKLEAFRVGTGAGERGFVHVKLALLSGRSAQIKTQLSESLLAGLKDLGDWPAGVEVQLSVEVVDLDRESYAKVTF
ncbi:5-carboxymethyl-2-hydroxymuconate Delta-isomerase [Pseudomonas batumici]|uniref:Putative 5-carboxymethyl-2-hydroxymuconate delta isomerase n=1 Tax=Pseudomonas batumici TaxID=226910 RepID=A0A0C2IA16_9PSED|nr:5-carboxymethyl-2-hydroxymuconate Delta-isomerase [Pseudomonas batumici]KIH81947.1 putative 5-carboxymethyl-2-hydroxymuconate delta isomerase [Pseudomonas batumici]